MNPTDTRIIAHDCTHDIDLIRPPDDDVAALRMRRPPWLSHQLSATAAELLLIVEEFGPVNLHFLGARDLTFCTTRPSFLAIFSAGICPGFGYTPRKLNDPDPDEIFSRFPRVPLIVAGDVLVANGNTYAEIMCKRGES